MTVTAQDKTIVRSPQLKAAGTETVVFNILKRLLTELKSQQATHTITLDSHFDRDIGLDSLMRVELLNRVEDHFSIVFPQDTYINTNTLRELCRAIADARNGTVANFKPEIDTALSAVKEASSSVTLLDVLQFHSTAHPNRKHIQLYQDDGKGETISYGMLASGAEKIAIGLQYYGVRSGDNIALMLQAGKEYFYCFFGILTAGATPVPIYPPTRPSQLEEHIQRHGRILSNCEAKFLITMPQAKTVAKLLKTQVPCLEAVLTFDDLNNKQDMLIRPVVSPNDLAFLQYTSGSTGNPKGVMLSHANILANIRAMGSRVQANSKDVFVSWLPLYHDMGLIGSWLSSMYFGMLFVVMSPLDFLSRPQRWLWAIHQYHGTLSASPNFGYEYCIHRLNEKDLKDLDLSSWRVAFDGAEAVSPDTVIEFCKRFSRYGFQPKAFAPVYGLAENSVGLAFPEIGRGPLIDQIQRDPFTRNGLAIPVIDTVDNTGDNTPDSKTIRFVACGSALEKNQIRIVDSANQALPDRQEGYIQFRGPSATRGYFNNPEQTRTLFSQDWLNTGDLGYIANGDIYITGRVKDIIIKAGRNLYPDELEQAVGNLNGIRKGRVAIFGSRHPQSGTERFIVVAESRVEDKNERDTLIKNINRLTADLAGTEPDEIVLAPPNTILKTSSGKIRRAASREVYEKGLIGKGAKTVWWQLIRLMASGFLPQLHRVRLLLSRAIFGLYAQLLFLIIATSTWIMVWLLPKSSQRWSMIIKAAHLLSAVTRTPITVNGSENLLPVDKPCIYVSNHMSYLDGPALITAINKPFSFVAKAELRRSFVSRIFLTRIGSEFVERFDVEKGVADTERLVEHAQSGRSLLFFPEGTFTHVPGLLPFHLGAFVVAAKSGLPVVPVTIQGLRSIFPAGARLPNPGSITIHIHPPINTTGPSTYNHTKIWQQAMQLRDQSRAIILAHCQEPNLGV